MRHRLDRHNPVGLGLLSLVEAADERVKTHRKVGRLDKRPGKILVPVFSVAAPFALAVGKFLAPHAATVRSKVSYCGESPYISGL